MGDVLILGGGICGLLASMMFARDGNDVTVLDRDMSTPPDDVDDAVRNWERPGVAQFRQVHYMQSRFRHTLENELPDVVPALIDHGARVYEPHKASMPPTVEDRSIRPDDDRFRTVTGRRQMLELVIRRLAEDERSVRIVRGSKVTELVLGAEAIDGVPHVVGVKTDSGDEFRADLVVDAMGRGSRLPELLRAAGGRPPIEEAEDSGYTYYGRYFRGPNLPEQIGRPLSAHGSFSALTLPADNDTWFYLLFIESGDQPLKELRRVEKWERLAGSLPWKAHWMEGEPVSDGVDIMSGILDRYRRYVVDDVPVVTGILPIADAWACTNPSLGRGVSLGVWSAQLLRELVRDANDDPAELARAWDEVVETTLTPWYRMQVDMDRRRVVEMAAAREGRTLPPPAADDVQAKMTEAFFTAISYDADCFRAFMENMNCLALPDEFLSRPGMFEKVIAAADGREPIVPPGPDRAEVLELLA